MSLMLELHCHQKVLGIIKCFTFFLNLGNSTRMVAKGMQPLCRFESSSLRIHGLQPPNSLLPVLVITLPLQVLGYV